MLLTKNLVDANSSNMKSVKVWFLCIIKLFHEKNQKVFASVLNFDINAI